MEYQNALYPNDIKLKELLKELEETICLMPSETGLSQSLMDFNINVSPDFDGINMSINEENISKKKKSTISKEEKMNKIKLKLEESIIKRDVLELNLAIQMNSKECLRNILKLEATIRTFGNKQLKEYASLGEAISKLKMFDPVNYFYLLKQNNIIYDISYVNFLIRFSDLCLKCHKILECCVSIHYIKSNFKIIKEICDNHYI